MWAPSPCFAGEAGVDDLDIVILTEYDFSGNMYNLASSVNRYTRHRAVAIKEKINQRLQYPTMIHATRENMSEVRELIYKADAVIWKETPNLMELFGLDSSAMKRKNNIVILGGGGYTSEKFFSENQIVYGELGAKWATSSLDFTRKNPDWAWIPASIRVEHLRAKYDRTKGAKPLLFASPSRATDKMLNVRGKFLFIVEQLRKAGFDFRDKVVFNEPNEVCLHLKAAADIFFDRVYDIYGINSQEAAVFESVVVTGTSEYVKEKLLGMGYECPFVIVDHHVLAIDEVAYYLENPDEVRKKGRECYEYVKEVHSGELATRNLMKLINK